MDNTFLYNKLVALPDTLKLEVADFIDFLLKKAGKNTLASTKGKIGRPIFGSGKGTFKMHSDFDEPLDDFKDYMN